MIAPPLQFDRDIGLAELMSAGLRAALARSLAPLLPGGFRLVDAGGATVIEAGELGRAPARAPVRIELETVGYLESAAGAPVLTGAAQLVQLLLHQLRRYQMVADLHLEAVHEDHRVLQEKHARLEESEARYRALAASLEVRVIEQVAQIEVQQRQLYQAEKMAAVGQLAAGMAHEINNPLGFVRSNLSAAVDYVKEIAGLADAAAQGDGTAIRAYWVGHDLSATLQDFAALLGESASGVDRVARIVADLKEFSNIDRTGRQALDLNEQVRAVCNIAAAQIGRTASVELALAPLPPVHGDAGRINQALLNLLVNAAQAVTPPGKIILRTFLVAGAVHVEVTDTGCGIAPEVLPRIFEPFFTSREVGAGTGLGLTVTRDIVQAHGGRIDVMSTVGAGSTFTVILPVGDAT